MKYLSFLLGTMLLVSNAWANNWWNDIKNDRVQTVATQLQEGRNPNDVNPEGHTAIIYAVREDAKRVALFLAKHPRTQVNLANQFDETPLMYAAISGDIALADLLVQRGAQINRLGWAPLHYAAAKGDEKMIQFLLQRGAFPNAPAADGSSALYLAVKAGKEKAIQTLVAAGADPRAINQEGKSALSEAKAKKMNDIIPLLNAF